MAQPTSAYFEQLTSLVRQTLDRIDLNRLDVNPDRAIWEAHGAWQESAIRLKEIFTSAGRMYSYYVIHQDNVVIGFDNYPDLRALRLKYGKQVRNHISECIPHKHGLHKATLELTDEMTVQQFLDEILKELNREHTET